MASKISLFNHWLARISAKYMPANPTKSKNKVFDPTQKDKPSPISPFTYNQFMRYLPRAFPKSWNVSRSFIGWTNSMEPTFDYGDMNLRITYEDFKKKGLDLVGAVAIYDYFGQRIIHRCIERLSDGRYIFKGDNNFRADPPVKESQIQDVQIGVMFTFDKIKEGKD